MSNIKLSTILKRTMRGKCPNCGEGKLFSSYLKPVISCAKCNDNFENISADDGPAWLTILFVGHIIVPLAIMMDKNNNLPDWEFFSILAILAMSLILITLPRAKGLFIGMIWRSLKK